MSHMELRKRTGFMFEPAENRDKESLGAEMVALLCSHAFRLHIEKGFMMP